MSGNEKHPSHKGFQIVILVFAIIGMLSVLGFSIIGILAVKDYFSDHESKSSQKVTEAQDDKEDALNEIINSEKITKNGNEEDDGYASVTAEGLKNAVIPETEASNDADISVYDDGKLKITFFGDSILDGFRDETGIAYRVATDLDATVYNLAIGGTCVTPEADAQLENDKWNCTCGLGMAKALAGEISIDALRDCTATQIMREHLDEIRQSDIFIIEYGINDFMSGKATSSDDYISGMTTYVGALREMVRILQGYFPSAKIIICQPSYLYFYRDNGEYIGDTYSLNNGPGSEFDYAGKAEVVSNEYGTYLYTLDRQGINSYNCEELMIDGVHLNESGRSLYAANLIDLIKHNVLGITE